MFFVNKLTVIAKIDEYHPKHLPIEKQKYILDGENVQISVSITSSSPKSIKAFLL